jgi:hypothetical protein
MWSGSHERGPSLPGSSSCSFEPSKDLEHLEKRCVWSQANLDRELRARSVVDEDEMKGRS